MAQVGIYLSYKNEDEDLSSSPTNHMNMPEQQHTSVLSVLDKQGLEETCASRESHSRQMSRLWIP